MGYSTKIEWCDSTWNPVTGCLHGCEYCYAMKIANRFSGYIPEENPGTVKIIEDTLSGKPIPVFWSPMFEVESMQARRKKDGRVVPAIYPFGFCPTFHKYRLDEPSRIEKLKNIFVCSMADLFGQWVPDSWIEAVFEACEKAPQHRYLFLTKNPQRYADLARNGKLPKKENMWYGSTVDSMSARRYPGRLQDNTFVSIEPLTEYMDLGIGSFGGDRWVIIGAETGNRKGKVTPKKEWIDKICEAADLTKMAVFMKDSLIPIVGEENMRREFPWDREEQPW